MADAEVMEPGSLSVTDAEFPDVLQRAIIRFDFSFFPSLFEAPRTED